nr:hypothetical protein [Caldilineaceae bacterium]
TLREATLHAQYLWERWQAQLTRPSKARTQDLGKRGELLLAHSQEAQAAWASVLHELALAEQAYDHFLPADAQWLAARMYQHYPQILHATERVRSVVEA